MQSFVKFCPPKEKKMQLQGAYWELEIGPDKPKFKTSMFVRQHV